MHLMKNEVKMKPVRIGLIGIGIMGAGHLKYLLELSDLFEVTALCDIDPARFSLPGAKGIPCFENFHKLLDSGLCEAVGIATPHPCHGEISIAAFAAGMHVFCEKPLTVSVSECDRVLAAAKKSGKVFATDFAMRTFPVNRVMRDWIKKGKLGKLLRVDCVCTRWLRSQKYFDMQSWRGTWNGEGGGLLMNQAPHNLDLFYFLFGEMSSCRAKLAARFHRMEAEDEAEICFRTRAGVPVRFYANTGEAPGRDTIEIVGDQGTLVRDTDGLHFRKLEKNISTLLAGEKAFPEAKYKNVEINVLNSPSGVIEVWRNFAAAVRGGTKPVAPGEEGIHAVEFANAATLSHFSDAEIAFPIVRRQFDRLLQKLRNGDVSLERTFP